METLARHVETIYQLPKQADIIRIKIVGDEGVGISAFIKCNVLGSYDPYLQSNLGLDFMTREIQVEDEKVVLQLWECEPPSYNGVIIMYDITSRLSFVNAIKTIEELREKHDVSLPILLLANKMDTDHKRKVMAYEGEMMSLQLQVLFYEISCTETNNTGECLVEFIESLLSNRF